MHLTRQRARELPRFIGNPAFDPRKGLRLAPGLQLVITRDRRPVESFVPGWQADAICLLFYPVIILQFRSSDGQSAYWLLDPSFNYLASSLGELPVSMRGRIRQRLDAITLFLSKLVAGAIRVRMPDDVACFLQLAGGNRQEMLSCFKLEGGENPAPDAIHQEGFTLAIKIDQSGDHRLSEQNTLLLQHGGAARLQSGWRMDTISTVFFPLLVASLQHEDGRQAYWFFDQFGRYVIDRWDLLPEQAAATLIIQATIVLEDIWQDLVCELLPRPRDHVAAFLALPLDTRLAVFDFLHSPPRPQAPAAATWTIADPPSASTAHIASTERGAALLDRAAVEQCLLRFIPQQNINLANNGRISWPSPLDGSELAANGCALLIDDLGFAFRVQDPSAGMIFYVIAFGWHFRTFALYLPDNDLLIARDRQAMAEAQHFAPNYRLRLLRHVVEFGAFLLAGAVKPPGPVTHCFRGFPAMHIGHFLWQDLSGVQELIEAVRPDRLPFFMVPETYLKPEIYGPIDELFPVLKGRVLRTDAMFRSLIPGFYEGNSRVIKSTSMWVRRSLGRQILDTLSEAPDWHALLSARARLTQSAEITVLIGLRAGDRAMLDATFVLSRLLDGIWAEFPTALIVVDGQNSTLPSDEPVADGSALSQERVIAEALIAHARVRGGRMIIDNIGRPIAESLLWCEAADFFVAPWGAALAKYRWVCNKPGLVTTGSWNLRHRGDLSIYHAPNINENPAPLWFIDPAAVEDQLDPGETDPERLGRANYRLDTDLIVEQLIGLLRAQAEMRKRETVEANA